MGYSQNQNSTTCSPILTQTHTSSLEEVSRLLSCRLKPRSVAECSNLTGLCVWTWVWA